MVQIAEGSERAQLNLHAQPETIAPSSTAASLSLHTILLYEQFCQLPDTQTIYPHPRQPTLNELHQLYSQVLVQHAFPLWLDYTWQLQRIVDPAAAADIVPQRHSVWWNEHQQPVFDHINQVLWHEKIHELSFYEQAFIIISLLKQCFNIHEHLNIPEQATNIRLHGVYNAKNRLAAWEDSTVVDELAVLFSSYHRTHADGTLWRPPMADSTVGLGLPFRLHLSFNEGTAELAKTMSFVTPEQVWLAYPDNPDYQQIVITRHRAETLLTELEEKTPAELAQTWLVMASGYLTAQRLLKKGTLPQHLSPQHQSLVKKLYSGEILAQQLDEVIEATFLINRFPQLLQDQAMVESNQTLNSRQRLAAVQFLCDAATDLRNQFRRNQFAAFCATQTLHYDLLKPQFLKHPHLQLPKAPLFQPRIFE